MATRQNIVNGPSKFDLMTALFKGDFQNRENVVFILKQEVPVPAPTTPDTTGGRKVIDQIVAVRARKTGENGDAITILINSVEREDGSGEEWSFKGYQRMSSGDSRSGEVRGHYSTKSRSGWISHNET